MNPKKSDTETDAPARAPSAEPSAGKTQAEQVPAGYCEVHVAIPGKVGTGVSTRPFAKAGETLVVTEATAGRLEDKQLAFRDKGLADAKRTMWEREQEIARKAALEAARRRVGRIAAQIYDQA